jgi:hypothetical protein
MVHRTFSCKLDAPDKLSRLKVRLRARPRSAWIYDPNFFGLSDHRSDLEQIFLSGFDEPAHEAPRAVRAKVFRFLLLRVKMAAAIRSTTIRRADLSRTAHKLYEYAKLLGGDWLSHRSATTARRGAPTPLRANKNRMPLNLSIFYNQQHADQHQSIDDTIVQWICPHT